MKNNIKAGFNAYIGIARTGVNICPIGYTDPKYPATEPWCSGDCANDNEDDMAGRSNPPPNPLIIIAK